MRISGLIFSTCILALLAGCSSNGERTDVQVEETADVLYNRAAKALDDGEYIAATRDFEEVERQHPYSKWATQAQLMAAYAYFEGERYDEAVMSLDRFIELHPGSSDIDYAYYLKALCYYRQISGVERDQGMSQDALTAFESLIRRFPDSRYTRDATLKRDLVVDHLAGKEMEIGRYYLERNHLNAAINRFKSVIEKYQTTSHTAEALHRLVEIYVTLGLQNEATHVAAVLGYNYPGSSWYERSYALLDPQQRQLVEDERGLVERSIESLLRPE